jgi:hypothetical protein
MAKCITCAEEFDPNATEPKRAGYEVAIYRKWINYRKNFDLCEAHLVEMMRRI